MSSILVGMFDSEAAATQARAKLMDAGFSSTAVTMKSGSSATVGLDANANANANPVAASVTHHEGGFVEWFKSLFTGDDSPVGAAYTDTYNEAFRRGSCGLSVTAANEAELDKAEMILNSCGAFDIDEKSDEWRKEGWTGGALSGRADVAAGALQDGQNKTLQQVEEELQVGKRAVARGGVRIFSRTTEVPVEETVRLREEHANVQRAAVDRPATEADFKTFKEGSMEIREMSEEAVVSKPARVTGEVSVGKEVSERMETIGDTVRKTEVDVEQIDGGTKHPNPASVSAYADKGASLSGQSPAGKPRLDGGSSGAGTAPGGSVGGSPGARTTDPRDATVPLAPNTKKPV